MKKLLEVLQYGDGDIRFNTDIDVNKNPDQVEQIAPMAAFAMATSLIGGNEISVLAVLRSLAIADLAISVNRKEMVAGLDNASRSLARCMNQAKEEMVKKGMAVELGPGVVPPRTRS